MSNYLDSNYGCDLLLDEFFAEVELDEELDAEHLIHKRWDDEEVNQLINEINQLIKEMLEDENLPYESQQKFDEIPF